jgi:hypothetical protein
VLHDVVDVLAWDDGVRYLAALTGLTKLSIKQSCLHSPLTSAQVQPLTGLTRLENCYAVAVGRRLPLGRLWEGLARPAA